MLAEIDPSFKKVEVRPEPVVVEKINEEDHKENFTAEEVAELIFSQSSEKRRGKKYIQKEA